MNKPAEDNRPDQEPHQQAHDREEALIGSVIRPTLDDHKFADTTSPELKKLLQEKTS